MPHKDLGSYSVDFDEYFMMWDSVLFFPNPEDPKNSILFGHSGDVGLIPCHKHRSCGANIKVESPFPPRVCIHCHVDTRKEFDELSYEDKLELFKKFDIKPTVGV